MVFVGAGSSLGLGALVLHARALFDQWLPIGGRDVRAIPFVGGAPSVVGETPRPLWENIPLVLGHPHRGILLYSPVLLILLPGIRAGWRAAQDWVRWAALAGVLAMIVQLLSNPGSFHGGDDFFGYRLPLEMLTLSTPLLALSAEHWVLPRWLATRMLVLTGVATLLIFALGSTIADPVRDDIPRFWEKYEKLGPHGEGYEGPVGLTPVTDDRSAVGVLAMHGPSQGSNWLRH
jgi:alpha-1,2-mannosyltransferase